eukprot:TRINITY_DN10241_c0_g1_i1.p1 TRINITY_DN10241_c0_g1~~TRINITY_DN10241_c0_g1_i1.p1  ORF type:complete len:349 (+),score=78.54 TRINITY_DN10241_c0_g1_i1:126-1172(+)
MIFGSRLSTDCEDSGDESWSPRAPAVRDAQAENGELEVPFGVRAAVVAALIVGVVWRVSPGLLSLPALLAVCGAVAAIYGLFLAGMLLGEEALIFPTHLLKDVHENSAPADAEVRWVGGEEANSEAWFFTAPARGKGAALPLAVIFHGNGECIDQVVPLARWYVTQGCHALLVEYQGYGRSKGRPSQRTLVADAAQHLEGLLARPEVDERRVLYHGRSLGGGVACQLALRSRPAALVLESTFASVADIAADRGVPRTLASACLRNPFDNAAALRQLASKGALPAFVAHGTRDEVVPHAHGAVVARELGAGVYSRECGHDLPFDSDYAGQLGMFLRKGLHSAPSQCLRG